MKLDEITIVEKLTDEELEKRRKAGLEVARANRDWSTRSKGSRLTGRGRGTRQSDQSISQK